MSDISRPRQRPPAAHVAAALPARATSPAVARRLAADVLRDNGFAALTDTVGVLVSELVTNVLVHADGPCRFSLRFLPEGAVRVEVYDGVSSPPIPRTTDAADATGRGLFLIDALASTWGHHQTCDGGKVVWVELDL